MGLFLSGLAINKDYRNKIDVLYNILKMNVVKTEEVTFEESMDSDTELFYFDVYFSSVGTLVFLNYDLCMHSYLVEESNTLSFIISENSDTYSLNYTENGKEKIHLEQVAGVLKGSGKKIIKDNNLTIDELVFKYIENLIGKRFFDIGNEEKLIRCYVSNYDWLKKPEVNKTNILEPLDLIYFSDEELLDLFNKLVEYCKSNNINFFLHTSLQEPENQIIVQNIIDLKRHVEYKENLLKILKPKFPMDSYSMIGKFKKENLDQKISIMLFDLIKNISISNKNVNQKWNDSNKKLIDNKKTKDSDFLSMIFVILFILALLVGLIYVFYNVIALP